MLTVLCSIHKGFCLRQGISSPISDLTQRLLLEERDPPAIPQESLSEAPPFDEVRFLKYAHLSLDVTGGKIVKHFVGDAWIHKDYPHFMC